MIFNCLTIYIYIYIEKTGNKETWMDMKKHSNSLKITFPQRG